MRRATSRLRKFLICVEHIYYNVWPDLQNQPLPAFQRKWDISVGLLPGLTTTSRQINRSLGLLALHCMASFDGPYHSIGGVWRPIKWLYFGLSESYGSETSPAPRICQATPISAQRTHNPWLRACIWLKTQRARQPVTDFPPTRPPSTHPTCFGTFLTRISGLVQKLSKLVG